MGAIRLTHDEFNNMQVSITLPVGAFMLLSAAAAQGFAEYEEDLVGYLESMVRMKHRYTAERRNEVGAAMIRTLDAILPLIPAGMKQADVR